MLDCQTRNSEGVFEKKNNFRRGGGRGYGNGIPKAWGIEHFGISEGKGGGGKISMPPVVWYRYFLESPICRKTNELKFSLRKFPGK